MKWLETGGRKIKRFRHMASPAGQSVAVVNCFSSSTYQPGEKIEQNEADAVLPINGCPAGMLIATRARFKSHITVKFLISRINAIG